MWEGQKEKFIKKLSLRPISESLQKKLNTEVRLIEENINKIKNKIFLKNLTKKF